MIEGDGYQTVHETGRRGMAMDTKPGGWAGQKLRGVEVWQEECNAKARMSDGESFALQLDGVADRASSVALRVGSVLERYLRDVPDGPCPPDPAVLHGSEYFRSRSNDVARIEQALDQMCRVLDRFEG